MSLEQNIAELTTQMTALATIMEKVVHNQERLLAGQQAAIEKVAAGNPETATRRGRKPKTTDAAETPTTEESPAATESGEQGATTASDKKPAAASTDAKATPKFADVSKKWLDKAEKGTDEYKARGAKIMGILGNFGAGKMSELPEDAEAEAMFYLKRHVKGLTVTYGAAYDFAGDPEQAEPEAVETADASDDFAGDPEQAEPEAVETADASDDDDDLFN